MKHFLSLSLALSLFLVTGICSAQVVSGPSIALPPAEVILNACKEMGVEAVGGEYVISKMPDLINKTGKVFGSRVGIGSEDRLAQKGIIFQIPIRQFWPDIAESRRIRGMGMDYGPDILPGLQNPQMERPLQTDFHFV